MAALGKKSLYFHSHDVITYVYMESFLVNPASEFCTVHLGRWVGYFPTPQAGGTRTHNLTSIRATGHSPPHKQSGTCTHTHTIENGANSYSKPTQQFQQSANFPLLIENFDQLEIGLKPMKEALTSCLCRNHSRTLNITHRISKRHTCGHTGYVWSVHKQYYAPSTVQQTIYALCHAHA